MTLGRPVSYRRPMPIQDGIAIHAWEQVVERWRTPCFCLGDFRGLGITNPTLQLKILVSTLKIGGYIPSACQDHDRTKLQNISGINMLCSMVLLMLFSYAVDALVVINFIVRLGNGGRMAKWQKNKASLLLMLSCTLSHQPSIHISDSWNNVAE